MKKEFTARLPELVGPALQALLGLLLLFRPDSLSALLGRILGWLLLLSGMGMLLSAWRQRRPLSFRITGAVLAVLGAVCLRVPLIPAANLGRLIGVLLVLRGGADLSSGQPKPLAGLTLTVGILLLLLPMTVSRLVFRGCGLAAAVTGALELLRRLRSRPVVGRPDIIDAL